MARVTRSQIAEIYARVSSPDGLLHYVARARTVALGLVPGAVGADDPYSGQRLVEISQARVGDDIRRSTEAAELFRQDKPQV